MNRFVIITPAYNEGQYIDQTIKSVLAQTVKPVKWVIIDDGSTDETSLVIQRYAAKYRWVECLRREKVSGQHYFASNVYAIQEGIDYLGGLSCEYLAILDADISLPPNYYEKILFRLSRDPRFGIASGVYIDRLPNGRFRKVLNDRRSTPKSITVFRRSCYEQIGGFVPMKYGGEDTVACFMARMKGWKTWSYPDIVVVHNKPVGTGHASNMLKIRFRQGWGECFLGNHPLFFLLKSLRRCVKEQPYFIGGLARIVGYITALFSREPRQIPDTLVRFVRQEQWQRIIRFNFISSDPIVPSNPQ